LGRPFLGPAGLALGGATYLFDPMPGAPLARKYVPVKPLVTLEMEKKLPTQMRRLHDWYMQAVKEDIAYLRVAVREEHFYREDTINIELEELFLFYNQDALDKSLISAYCL